MTTSCSRLGDCHLCLTVFTVCLRNYKIPQTRSLTRVLHFRVEWASLKKQLRRKEKALAEAAALLILKKKVDQLWETEEVD